VFAVALVNSAYNDFNHHKVLKQAAYTSGEGWF